MLSDSDGKHGRGGYQVEGYQECYQSEEGQFYGIISIFGKVCRYGDSRQDKKFVANLDST